MIDRASRSLEELAEAHSKFIDSLTDLIPAAFYRDQSDHVDLRHMSKEARAATKQAFKEKHKRSKREKLDPSARRSTTDAIKAGPRGGEASGSDREDDAPAPRMALNLADAKASKTELQDRLRKRLEALSAKRKNPKDKEPREKKGAGAGAQAPKKGGDEKQRRVEEARAWREGAAGKRKAEDAGRPEAAKRAKAEEPELDLQFPVLDLEGPQLKRFTGDAGRKEAQKAKKKDKAAVLAQLERGEGPADDKLQVALARARGERVLDDPKLLRKALKKESKSRERSGKQWQQRQEKEEETKAARQNKRKDNLKARKDQKIKTKIAKREKKLGRPGFEGRKDGFITKS